MMERVHLYLGASTLDVNEAVAFVTDDAAGGIAVFAGTTRRITDDRETLDLEYEAYEEMALSEMKRLTRIATQRWPLEKVYLAHRLGRVHHGEMSVLIAVSSPHRSEAFEACRFLIDRVKSQVPIWKRETFVGGGREWVPGKMPDLD